MKIRVTVQWRLSSLPARSFTCDRKTFADFMNRKADSVDWLIADVCLTRWYFDGADWYSMPLVKYVPNNGVVRLSPQERRAKLRKSTRGFTQC